MQYGGGYFFGNRFGWLVEFFTFFLLKEYRFQLHYGNKLCNNIGGAAWEFAKSSCINNIFIITGGKRNGKGIT
ncbi:hypothetical protein J8TS2_32890 [Lederbergia ruris]|uniref:Uncharacterized protein n=1 Tax=Lederbergia ruris TaxID=217495 RepID=A0ABQ4KM12_9BACI|nr:hypothetical protein J8TS2_32890 [Lederbergia ruris]